jgi:hypothetical protein
MSIWIESVRVLSVLLRHSDTDAHRSTIWGDAFGATQVEASSDERATYICFRVLLVCTEGLYVHTVQMCT